MQQRKEYTEQLSIFQILMIFISLCVIDSGMTLVLGYNFVVNGLSPEVAIPLASLTSFNILVWALITNYYLETRSKK